MYHYNIAPGPPLMPPQMSLRVRKEPLPKPVMQDRLYQHWMTDAPSPQNNRVDVNAQAAFYDMNATNSRSTTQNYRFQPSYDTNAKTFESNPYFQKYDFSRDPRNFARDVKSAVFEPNSDRGTDASRKIIERGFQIRHEPVEVSQEITNHVLDAYERMKPKMNDQKAVFR